ncbi:MAG TPA: RNA polymerase sigma factor [Bacillales bacterium]|jgi:RNA polymerase sigma-70 factor (ECF subfamily)|nr:RNA polymerase sigma factor [Bacillales bacterium]
MDEEKIIQRAKAGDAEAFRTLVEHYFPIVERFAYQIGSPSSHIEDITQEVFLRVYRFLDRYSSGKFTTWLYRITLNVFRDMMRKDKRNRERVERLSQQPQPESRHVEDQLLADAEHRHLHNLITGLDEKYKVPLVLFYFHEKKYDEIADILAIPLSTVKTRISRARARLKTALESSKGGEKHD